MRTSCGAITGAGRVRRRARMKPFAGLGVSAVLIGSDTAADGLPPLNSLQSSYDRRQSDCAAHRD